MVRIVAPKVVKHNWHLMRFGVYSQFKVTLVVRRSSVLSRYMTMVFYRVSVVLLEQWLFTFVTVGLFFCFLLVLLLRFFQHYHFKIIFFCCATTQYFKFFPLIFLLLIEASFVILTLVFYFFCHMAFCVYRQ